MECYDKWKGIFIGNSFKDSSQSVRPKATALVGGSGKPRMYRMRYYYRNSRHCEMALIAWRAYSGLCDFVLLWGEPPWKGKASFDLWRRPIDYNEWPEYWRNLSYHGRREFGEGLRWKTMLPWVHQGLQNCLKEFFFKLSKGWFYIQNLGNFPRNILKNMSDEYKVRFRTRTFQANVAYRQYIFHK